jgi:FKBP-type peptidyl-prolyl cis-trans isomerase 2
MAEAQSGDTVKVHYKGTLEDGTVFDDSHGDEPIEFTIGNEELIPGFEEAVIGMSPDESREVTIEPEDAYGDRREDLVAAIDRDELPDDMDIEEGQHLRMEGQDGQTMIVRVVELEEETVTLDGNHPLAGKNLTFDIELLEIAEEGEAEEADEE